MRSKEERQAALRISQEGVRAKRDARLNEISRKTKVRLDAIDAKRAPLEQKLADAPPLVPLRMMRLSFKAGLPITPDGQICSGLKSVHCTDAHAEVVPDSTRGILSKKFLITVTGTDGTRLNAYAKKRNQAAAIEYVEWVNAQ